MMDSTRMSRVIAELLTLSSDDLDRVIELFQAAKQEPNTNETAPRD